MQNHRKSSKSIIIKIKRLQSGISISFVRRECAPTFQRLFQYIKPVLFFFFVIERRKMMSKKILKLRFLNTIIAKRRKLFVKWHCTHIIIPCRLYPYAQCLCSNWVTRCRMGLFPTKEHKVLNLIEKENCSILLVESMNLINPSITRKWCKNNNNLISSTQTDKMLRQRHKKAFDNPQSFRTIR